jgi:biopolymer transport protein ExbD
MIHFERPGRRLKPLLLTPLVDIFFLLIIFFLLTTSFIKIQALELGLPGKDDGHHPAMGREPLLVDVAGDGAIYWQRELVLSSTLRQRVAGALAKDKMRNVLVRSGKGVSVQKLVSVLDILYQEGGRDVSVDKWDERDRPAAEGEAGAALNAVRAEEEAIPVLNEREVEHLPQGKFSPQEELEDLLSGAGGGQ